MWLMKVLAYHGPTLLAEEMEKKGVSQIARCPICEDEKDMINPPKDVSQNNDG